MTKYRVFHPDHEIIGHVVQDIEAAIGGEHLYPIFAKHGLAKVDPNSWYSMQDFLNALKELDEGGNAIFDLVSAGMNTVENLVVPPEFTSLSPFDMLAQSDALYHTHSRGTDIGYIAVEQVANSHVVLTYHAPLPDDYWYGIVYGFCRRFFPPHTAAKVYFDTTMLRREEGGEDTVIHVTW